MKKTFSESLSFSLRNKRKMFEIQLNLLDYLDKLPKLPLFY